MPNFYNLLRARKFTTSADTAIEVAPYDSATPNFVVEAGGKLKWSSGSAAADTNLYRAAANRLKTDDSFDVASGQTYKIDGADVLSSTTLGSTVVNSSLTSVGSLTSLTAATPNFNGNVTVTGNINISGNATWHADFNQQTTGSYVIYSSDDGKVVTMNNASSNIIYIDTNSSTPVSVGTQITIIQVGAGQTSIEPISGAVTIRTTTTRKLRSQYSVATLLKIATDEWILFGDLAAF